MVVGGGWDAVRMIVSLLCRAARTMLSMSAVLLRRDTAKDAELVVLRDENTVLRRQLKGPVGAEDHIRGAHAACWYSCRIPSRRSCRRTSRGAGRSGSVVGSGSGRKGCGAGEGSVGPVLVAERLVRAQGVPEVGLVPDEGAVEQFGPAGADSALRDRVRAGHPQAGLEDLDVVGGQDGVEAGRVAHTRGPGSGSRSSLRRPEVQGEVPGEPGDRVAAGWAVIPRMRTRRVACPTTVRTVRVVPVSVVVPKKPRARTAPAGERRKAARVV
jgi:hypothetical protein